MNFKNEVERKKEKNVRSNTVSAKRNLLFKNTEQVDCSQLYKWDIPSDLQSWFDLIVSELSS